MSRCLRENTLVLLRTGEGPQAAREHLRVCGPCAARYQKLVQDLEVIDRTLRDSPPTGLRAHAAIPRWQWRPLAAAAAILVVVIAGANVWLRRTPVAVHPLTSMQSTDTGVFLDEVSGVLFSADASLGLQTVLNDALCPWWETCDDTALVDDLLGSAWMDAET